MSTPPSDKKPIPSEKQPRDPLGDLVEGYPKLAGRMGQLPTAAMFRRFGALNARNLLYYQNELVHLENELKEAEAADRKSDKGWKRAYAEDSYFLMNCTIKKEGKPRDGDTKQLDLVLRIREVLKEYNQAILQQAGIIQLRRPHQIDLEHIQLFLNNRQMGPLTLAGPDRDLWGSPEAPDEACPELIALKLR